MSYCSRCVHSQSGIVGLPSVVSDTGYIKGEPVRVFESWSQAGLSDIACDITRHNAASIEVRPLGGNPSAVISVEGSPTPVGNFMPLIDPAADPQTITEAQIIDVLCGAAWLRVRLASVVGPWTVIVTPYVSPGATTVVATVN